MGIGHIAVGIGLKRAEQRLNVGVLVFAALLSDFLLGWFALAGWEGFQTPADYASKHYLLFTFPWSPGLVPLLVWATLCMLVWATLCGLLCGRVLWSRRAGVAVGIAVLSHYALDGIVHVKGLPVAGPGTSALGLGLWRNLPVEIAVEAAMAVIGIVIYLSAVRTHSFWRRSAMTVYVLALGGFTLTGVATATTVPPTNIMIASWILAPILFAGIAGLLDQAVAGQSLIADR